jgi:hypothetical protein
MNVPAVRTQKERAAIHQRAVKALIEQAIATPELMAAANACFEISPSEVPELFRAAITVWNGHENPYRHETAILETALELQQAADGKRTPEQDAFYSALAFGYEGDGIFRVEFNPAEIQTVN